MTNNIALGNVMIDIEENHANHKNQKTSNNDDDISIISDDNSDHKNEQMYPSDCYSFLSIYGPNNPGTVYFYSRLFC